MRGFSPPLTLGRTTQQDGVAQRRDIGVQTVREGDEIEFWVIAYDEMCPCASVTADIGDLQPAMGCERADRDKGSLEAGDECHDELALTQQSCHQPPL